VQPAVIAGRSMAVLYGSETGNAEDIAVELGRTAERLHFQTTVDEMDGFKLVRCPSAPKPQSPKFCRWQAETPSSNGCDRQMSYARRSSYLSRRQRARARCQRTR
jgi:hypothetical protein